MESSTVGTDPLQRLPQLLLPAIVSIRNVFVFLLFWGNLVHSIGLVPTENIASLSNLNYPDIGRVAQDRFQSFLIGRYYWNHHDPSLKFHRNIIGIGKNFNMHLQILKSNLRNSAMEILCDRLRTFVPPYSF